MDTNHVLDQFYSIQAKVWIRKVNKVYGTGEFCQWVSSFHSQRLPCALEGKEFHSGSFNAGMKMLFSDGTSWLVRFVFEGKVAKELVDEKVAMEVSALRIIRDKTTIPVPTVHAWGVSAENPLGLGPFIIMDFIEGVSLHDITLRNPDSTCNVDRVLRQDINHSEIEQIYRQMAGILLQLFQINFDQISNLPWPDTGSPGFAQPLTFKANSILQDGGVNPFSDRAHPFSDTKSFLTYLADQDWGQLLAQPNSVFDEDDARKNYQTFSVLRQSVGDFIHSQYDGGPFKLICDDFGLANLIVRSREDLTVIGVIDLEWSYAGPAQLFGSAPWWLLQDRPTHSAWDYLDGQPPTIGERYFKALELFIRILEEEEDKDGSYSDRELSRLMRWSQESGAMWLHMAISWGFGGSELFPFVHLQRHIGKEEWDRREAVFAGDKEMAAFVERKVRERGEYSEDEASLFRHYQRVLDREISEEEFLAIMTPILKDRGYLGMFLH